MLLRTSDVQNSNAAPIKTLDLGPKSRVFRSADFPVQRRSNGGESFSILAGSLVTGEQVAIHASTQPAGAEPNPAHAIQHTELLCLREGTLEFTHDGKTEQVHEGDVVLIAYGTNHGLRNVGMGPASYVVVALGGNTNR